MAPPAVGWHESQPLAGSTLSIPAPPSGSILAPTSVPGVAQDAAGGTKKSFSAAELDHVPRYIAPEDGHHGAASSPHQARPVSAEWQPNELASFSGAEWVPPAMAHEEAAAYVAPRAVATEPRRSPRNLIIAVVGVALVAGLGFGVNKALAPDSAIIVEPTTVETTAKASTTISTTISTIGAPTVNTRPATRAPGLVGAANAVAANETAATDAALAGEPATTVPTP